ncbi:MAG: Pr6Pr family membrane protein [bacterium]|nr:Pr6Pr family membrane protein [bacterium]
MQINKLYVQAIYRSIFCAISFLGCLLSLEFLQIGYNGTVSFNDDFYVFYTNLSNYLVFVVNAIVLWGTIKKLRAGETRGYNTVIPKLKYCTTIVIFVTFLVFAFVLPDEKYGLTAPLILTSRYWLDLANLCLHMLSPLLFVLDWFLFDKHHQIKVWHPFLTPILPIGYGAYIKIRGVILTAANDGALPTHTTVYPYFFLDSYEKGYGYVFCWWGILALLFLILGYLFWWVDKKGAVK